MRPARLTGGSAWDCSRTWATSLAKGGRECAGRRRQPPSRPHRGELRPQRPGLRADRRRRPRGVLQGGRCDHEVGCGERRRGRQGRRRGGHPRWQVADGQRWLGGAHAREPRGDEPLRRAVRPVLILRGRAGRPTLATARTRVVGRGSFVAAGSTGLRSARVRTARGTSACRRGRAATTAATPTRRSWPDRPVVARCSPGRPRSTAGAS